MTALFGTAITGDELRAVVTEFYQRIFVDPMIGYMFAGKDRQRLIDKEWELAANLLGAVGIPYTGRPMRAAHAQHAIFGGQFARRLKILQDVMRDLAVDAEVYRVWTAHTEALRSQITRDQGSECANGGVGPMLAREEPSSDRPIKLGRK